jgi:hypothetical protein
MTIDWVANLACTGDDRLSVSVLTLESGRADVIKLTVKEVDSEGTDDVVSVEISPVELEEFCQEYIERWGKK